MANGGLASGWKIARVFGITIRLHWTWIFIFFLLTFSLGSQILPLSNLAGGGSWWDGMEAYGQVRGLIRFHPGMTEEVAAARLGIALWPEWHYWVLAVVGSLGLFVCVLAHELAHSIVAGTSGMPVEGITLFVFGGVARIREEAQTPGAEFRVAAAGPLMSLAIAAACWFWYMVFGGWLYPQGRALVFYFMFINFMLVLFNLVPGFPLDGGRLLRAVLWKVLRDLRRATYIASKFGQAFAVVLMGIGLWDVLKSLLVPGRQLGLGAIWWIVIGLFLWNAAKASYQQTALRAAFAGLTVRDAIRPDIVSVAPDVALERLVDEYFYAYRFRSFPVLEDGRLVGVVSLKDVQAVPRSDWGLRRVGEVMGQVNEANLVRPDEDLASVFRKMMLEGKGHLPVVDAGRLVGIVTRHDIMALLQLKTDLGDRHAARAR